MIALMPALTDDALAALSRAAVGVDLATHCPEPARHLQARRDEVRREEEQFDEWCRGLRESWRLRDAPDQR